MANWGLVTTVKAPQDQVLAFLAHHLSLGASQIRVYFDDPEDPAFTAIVGLPRVTATRCTAAHWQACGGRHERHQNRQARNAKHAQRACELPWLGHIDVDEFIWPTRPLASILGEQADATLLIRMEPFEAMHDPTLPDDIFTARQFRGPLRDAKKDLRAPILGLYRSILPKGNLSHAVGKSFCRPSVKGISLRLHGAFLNGERLEAEFNADLPLLHFHAQDRAAWLAALPFRLTRGAYQYHPELQAHLLTATPDLVQHLYDNTQVLTPDRAALLQSEGRLITADLGLRRKVANLIAGRLP